LPVDQRVDEHIAEERDNNAPPLLPRLPFRPTPSSARRGRDVQIDRYAVAAALQLKKQKLNQPSSAAEQVETERAIAVLEALLNGTPLPRHLGTPIVSFDGNVSFAGEPEP
jgi:hypothetical protein